MNLKLVYIECHRIISFSLSNTVLLLLCKEFKSYVFNEYMWKIYIKLVVRWADDSSFFHVSIKIYNAENDGVDIAIR